MVAKHLSKQELKQDKVAVAAVEAADYLKHHLRIIGAVVGAVVVVALAAFLIVHSRTKAERQASLAMYEAQTQYLAGDFTHAASGFQKVAQEYGSTHAARPALLFEANANLSSGNAAEAEKGFRAFLDRHPTDPLQLAAAHRGLGGALVTEQKFADGAAEYATAAAVPNNSLSADDWLQAGRAYAQAGNTAEALKAYGQAAAGSSGPAPAEARILLQEASAGH